MPFYFGSSFVYGSPRQFLHAFQLRILFSTTALGFVYLWVSSTYFVLYYGFALGLLSYF